MSAENTSWMYRPDDAFLPGISYSDLVTELDDRLAAHKQSPWRFWVDPKLGQATRLRLARDYITGARHTARLLSAKSALLFLVVAKLVLPTIGLGRFFSLGDGGDLAGTLCGAGMLALVVWSSTPNVALDTCQLVADDLKSGLSPNLMINANGSGIHQTGASSKDDR